LFALGTNKFSREYSAAANIAEPGIIGKLALAVYTLHQEGPPYRSYWLGLTVKDEELVIFSIFL
jgi:hypothetical protein